MTYLCTQAREKNISMLNLVSEIPAYAEGKNTRCILSMIRKLIEILGIDINTVDLESKSAEFTKKLDKIVAGRPDLRGLIQRIEKEFDADIPNSSHEDLKDWFQRQEIEFD